MEYAVETNKLSKIYSKRKVIDEVSMHIPMNSIYGFVGENGSGKTTIIRLLTGLALPKSGDYTMFGVKNTSNEIYEIRKHVSAIVESPSLVPSMTAKQNLTFACQYYGIKDYSIINKVLLQVGLHDIDHKKVKDFSLGMRQRLGIAVLLLNEPNMMFLDEPMNGLDPQGIADLRDLILDLNKKGITFLISSHILSELEKVATHYGFIYKGHLLEEISAHDLYSKCQKGIDLSCEDMDKLFSTLKEAGYKNLMHIDNTIRVLDEVTPLEILSLLDKEGIKITNIKTSSGSVEEYYLSLLKEVQHV